MDRKQIIAELIKHKRFHFPGGQPFACYGGVRVFADGGHESGGTLTVDRCLESTEDLQSCLDWYQTNNWKKG